MIYSDNNNKRVFVYNKIVDFLLIMPLHNHIKVIFIICLKLAFL